MRVLVQLRSSPTFSAALIEGKNVRAAATAAKALKPAGLNLDPDFAPVVIPTPVPPEPGEYAYSMAAAIDFSFGPRDVTHVVRGTISDSEAQQAIFTAGFAHPAVVGIFSDPIIERCPVICPSKAIGSASDVSQALGVRALARKGLTGKGIKVAVVDTGTNAAHLADQGRYPSIDARASFTPAGVSTRPGKHPPDHGTMCAYDVGIAAPDATLLDHAVLLSSAGGATQMEGLLSDAILSFNKLLRTIQKMPSSRRALVVTNSWGMFSPTWDFPPGHPGNYSDNPRHPFNILVASLERAGADILFAAGNCGRDCPDSRCNFGRTRPICGANSHPSVISVAGIDVKRRRLGYSSQGPGRLTPRKPDVCAYTHFAGSGIYPADGGTSAACPVLAGVVAAVRTKYPASVLSPAALRSLVCKTADDLGTVGYDFDYGWGVIDPAQLISALAQAKKRNQQLFLS